MKFDEAAKRRIRKNAALIYQTRFATVGRSGGWKTKDQINKAMELSISEAFTLEEKLQKAIDTYEGYKQESFG